MHALLPLAIQSSSFLRLRKSHQRAIESMQPPVKKGAKAQSGRRPNTPLHSSRPELRPDLGQRAGHSLPALSRACAVSLPPPSARKNLACASAGGLQCRHPRSARSNPGRRHLWRCLHFARVALSAPIQGGGKQRRSLVLALLAVAGRAPLASRAASVSLAKRPPHLMRPLLRKAAGDSTCAKWRRHRQPPLSAFSWARSLTNAAEHRTGPPALHCVAAAATPLSLRLTIPHGTHLRHNGHTATSSHSAKKFPQPSSTRMRDTCLI